MVEAVQIGNATLYLGDCFEVLPTLGIIDVIVTDPPYGEVTHAGARTRIGPNGGPQNRVSVDFLSISAESFIRLSTTLVDVAARWVVMTCEWQHAAQLEASQGTLVRLGVWVKPNGAPQFTGDRPATGWEAVAILHRAGSKRWNGGGARAVWQCPTEHGEHPTQKPLRLISEWVSLFSDVGETVLDPFMGSGTTGVACAKLGRRFVGIELDPRYFDIACRRIEQAYKQADLFMPQQAARPMQERLF